MRGYNLSDKPRGIANYSMNWLTQDVRELVEHLGECIYSFLNVSHAQVVNPACS